MSGRKKTSESAAGDGAPGKQRAAKSATPNGKPAASRGTRASLKATRKSSGGSGSKSPVASKAAPRKPKSSQAAGVSTDESAAPKTPKKVKGGTAGSREHARKPRAPSAGARVVRPRYTRPDLDDFTSLVELLRHRAEHYGSLRLYTYLQDGEVESETLTCAGLDLRARAIAETIRAKGMEGKRIVLLYPQSLEYIAAFFGCLYAGAIAVPAYPPRNKRHMARIESIMDDSQAALALTNNATHARITSWLGASASTNVAILATDDLLEPAASGFIPASPGREEIAFLQYTSGSTSTPKGVMVSQGNLIANLFYMGERLKHTPDSVMVTWLPIFHDLGLIYGILQALFDRHACYVMSPSSFVQRPLRWLKAISRYGGTHCAAPNFAYELCVSKITPEQRDELDLKSWRLALNAAEPVRPSTLRKFGEYFKKTGFRFNTFSPAYGLAEATLCISASALGAQPRIIAFDADELEKGRAVTVSAGSDGTIRELAASGPLLKGQKARIINPETRIPCAAGEIGEIWYAGPTIAEGYWARDKDTEAVFRAMVSSLGKAGKDQGPFLRTGDLGFILDGRLFVTGRLKDLIIVDGFNFYPQDIELTVQRSHPALRADAGAAFAVEVDEEGAERLVIVQELERTHRKSIPAEIMESIRQAVAEQHDLSVFAVVLIRPGTVPRTSSGKIRRRAARASYLGDDLEVVARWSRDTVEDTSAMPAKSPVRIQDWLIEHISRLLKIDPAAVDIRTPIARIGLTSAQTIGLTGELENWLGGRLSPTLFYEYPTIESVVRRLVGEYADRGAIERPTEVIRKEEPIAIIGIGCRFPGGVRDPESFWKLLCDGVDAVTEIPPDRWDVEAYFDENPSVPGKMNTRWGGFVERPDLFDANFFKISAREAARMDPQQRQLLEVSYEALEDAGQSAERLRGTRVGVFMGVSVFDYGSLLLADPALSDAYTGTGGALSIAANRISYFYDFRGPSMAVDTACSSSLVALDLACRSIRGGESTMALAGGVNLILSPGLTVNFSKSGFMASDGRCKSFDESANGYVRGEGAGIVVLKPLSRALADRDFIYSVIRGTAVNQDGRSNGLTAPNPQAQEEVLLKAYHRAGISPGEVQYVEAHGTGTSLGDPIEASALGNVLSRDRAPGNVCRIGSVKTNLGHLEAAAGMAGLIKTALALKNRRIPPSLHFNKPNHLIPFEKLQLSVQNELAPWPAGPLLAGVSSFGFGGTNAHVVLQAFPRTPRVDSRSLYLRSSAKGEEVLPDFLLPLSARTEPALRTLAQNYLDFLGDEERARNFADICYTAAVRRGHLDYRLALTARTAAEAQELLRGYLAGATPSGLSFSSGPAEEKRRRKLVFVFSGQGSQWAGMGRDLMQVEPMFRKALEECDAAIQEFGGWSLLEELNSPSSSFQKDMPEITQPAIFAMQVSLFRLLRHYGIEPDAVLGQSMGEIAAAQAAGVLSLSDAARIVCRRGALLKRLHGKGAMLLVELPLRQTLHIVDKYESRVAIAARNGPETFLLVGEPGPVSEVHADLKSRDVFARMVNVAHASHSPQVESLKDELLENIRDISPLSSAIPFYSTVTGEHIPGTRLDAAYWYRNLREPVLVHKAVEELLKSQHEIFVEISPQPVLIAAFRKIIQGRPGAVVPTLRKDQPNWPALLESLGQLHTLGHSPDWAALYPEGNLVRLPSYPWQKERYWPDFNPADTGMHAALSSSESTPGRYFRLANPAIHVWENRLESRRLSRRARGGGVSLFFIEMIQRAAGSVLKAPHFVLSDIDFRPLPPLTGTLRAQLVLAEKAGDLRDNDVLDCRVYLAEDDDQDAWLMPVTGRIEARRVQAVPHLLEHELPRAISARCAQEAGPGNQSSFKVVRRGRSEVLAEMEPGDAPRGEARSAYLDEALQFLSLAADPEGRRREYLPLRLERIRFHRSGVSPRYCHALLRDREEGALEGELRFFDENENLLLELSGLRMVSPEYLAAGDAKRVPEIGRSQDKLAVDKLAAMDDDTRMRIVLNFLHRHCARVLGVPAEDLDVDKHLTAMGLTSITLFELRNWIRAEFSLVIPIRTFFQEMSINRLARYIIDELYPDPSRKPLKDVEPAERAERVSPAEPAPATRSFPEPRAAVKSTRRVEKKEVENPEQAWFLRAGKGKKPLLRIFAFPGMGAGPSMFRGMGADLPSEVELCITRYPGREERLGETPHDSMAPMLSELAPAMTSLLDVPFTFYGQGMGALIAFELARRLRAEAKLNPVHLFFSGHRAPHLLDPDPPQHVLGEEALLDILANRRDLMEDLRRNPERLPELLPLFRADLRLQETYVHGHRAPFECPITVFTETEPITPPAQQAEAWYRHTDETFLLHKLEVDDVFTRRAQKLIFKDIAEELTYRISELQLL